MLMTKATQPSLRVVLVLFVFAAIVPDLFSTSGKATAHTNNQSGSMSCPAPSFNFAPAYPVGNTPTEIVTGDFNQDGVLDLVTADNFELNVAVLFGNGKGEFGYPRKIDVQGRPYTLEAGDFNNDGALDLVVGIYQNQVVLLGNGRGSFGPPIKTRTSEEPRSTAVGDLDKDGNLDLVVTNNYSDLFLLFGDGRGGFSVKYNFIVSDPSDVIVVDLNRDGNLDLAMSRSFGDDVAIRFGDGKGQFSSVISYKVGDYPNHLVVADFNRDNLPDIATLNAASSDLSILLGNETKVFSAAVNYPLPFGYFGARAMTLGDFNEDGNSDLVIMGRTALVLYGDGKGAFPTESGFVSGGGSGVVIGDFDKNSHQDLAITTGNNTVALLSGNGAGKFAAPGNFNAGKRPIFVASADLNGDGKPDLAVANRDSDDLSLLFGDGTGNFGKPINLPIGDSPRAIAIADFNLDGKSDLAVAYYRASNNVFSVLLNNGSGGFNGPINFPIENYSAFIASSDLNGDGKPDLIVGGSGQNAVTILAGDGTGSFTVASTLSVGSFENGERIVITDFNQDGKSDLAISLTYDTLILLGDGKGKFTQSAKLSRGRTFTVGDFNADGKPDVAFYGFGQAEVYLGNGSGGFGSAIRTSSGGGDVFQLRAMDVNEDGKMDLIVLNSSPGVSVLLGDSQGKFVTELALPISPGPASLAMADFNLDGKLDLAVTGLAGGSVDGTNDVQVFLRTCVAAADLVVTGTSLPATVITGTDATYTVTITNTGTATATAVQVTGFNRGTLKAKSCIASDGGQCEIVTEGFFIQFNYRAFFDSLPPGESRTLTLVYPVDCSTFNNSDYSLSARVVSSTVEANPANNSFTISPKISNPPPVIKCPTEVATVTAKPRETSVVFKLPKPEATDNCPTVNVSCSEPFGNLYRLGANKVSCIAVDGAQSSASCNLTVVVYDTCLQDDVSGDSLLFNSYTGDYQFTRCGVGGFVVKGKAELSRDGCSTKLTGPTISAVVEDCILPIRHTGTATLRVSIGSPTLIIRDSNTTNNNCNCR